VSPEWIATRSIPDRRLRGPRLRPNRPPIPWPIGKKGRHKPKATQGPVLYTARAELVSPNVEEATILNGRDKTGGATGWERPGSDLA
jgi:hypothetical protein